MYVATIPWWFILAVAILIALVKTINYIKNRAQLKNPRTGRWVKVNTKRGGIVSHKKSKGPYKNVEKAKRRRRP